VTGFFRMYRSTGVPGWSPSYYRTVTPGSRKRFATRMCFSGFAITGASATAGNACQASTVTAAGHWQRAASARAEPRRERCVYAPLPLPPTFSSMSAISSATDVAAPGGGLVAAWVVAPASWSPAA
jgi:hypothetical protein